MVVPETTSWAARNLWSCSIDDVVVTKSVREARAASKRNLNWSRLTASAWRFMVVPQVIYRDEHRMASD
jgi:hypothetical protein